ncbi:MAG: BREX system ATP-binding domain-containing protein [candidate division WOR-3 bacterium]
MLNRGLICSHPVFGEGEILEERFRGQEFLVKFRTGIKLWLRKERLFFFSPLREEKIDQISARRMIEAFRLGIVPRRDIEDFTFGREEEISQFKKEMEGLKRGYGDCLLIEGQYGSGKTHLLEYFYHTGLKEGFLVSRVELDPREVSLARPKKVYREIIHNIRFLQEEKEGGFRDFLRQAAKLNIKDHIYFTPLLSSLKKMDEDAASAEVWWQWVEGESTKEYAVEHRFYRVKGGNKIPALYDFSTAVDFYCYLISGISYMARELGFFGFILLIDEAETVTHFWDMHSFLAGFSFLEGLLKTSLNFPELKRINYQYLHNGMRPTPYIYKDAYLLLIIAATPLPDGYLQTKIRQIVKKNISLSPLPERACQECFYHLVSLYRAAYPEFSLPPRKEREILLSAIASENLRDFIKFTVDYLDIERHAVTCRHNLKHRPSLSL